jgi:hypothetical protein
MGADDTEARAMTGVDPDGEVSADGGATEAVPVAWLAAGGTVAVPVTGEREVADEPSEDEEGDDEGEDDELNIGDVRTVVSAGLLSSLAHGEGGVLGVLIGTGAGGGADVTGGVVDDFGVKSDPPDDDGDEPLEDGEPPGYGEDASSDEGAADSAAPAPGVLEGLSELAEEALTVGRSDVPVGDSGASCSAAARVSTGASSASVEAPAAPDFACVSVIDQSCSSEVAPEGQGLLFLLFGLVRVPRNGDERHAIWQVHQLDPHCVPIPRPAYRLHGSADDTTV